MKDLYIDCVKTASKLYSFPASDKVVVIFDAFSPCLSFLYDQAVFISRTFYLLIEMNEVTNLQEQYQQAICQSCLITSVIVVSDYL